MREMTAAGRYYDRDRQLLLGEVAAHYSGPRGPGDLPRAKIEKRVRAIIAPNSPYKNCGDCMAWSFKELAESPRADVYVIIASHASPLSGLCVDTFLTPVDFVRVDQELAKAVAAKGHLSINDDVHLSDSQIEVQLPFLQHAKYAEMEHLKILPILLGTDADVRQIALDIKEAIVELGRDPIYVVSTNFTQYGPLFHNVPFVLDVQKNIHDLDKGAIDFVITQDVEGFRQYLVEKYMRIPGASAIELLLRVLRPCDVRLERYYTSADIMADYKNSVSYAAIVFEEKAPAPGAARQQD